MAFSKLVSIFYSVIALVGGAIAGFAIWLVINSKGSDLLKEVDDSRLTMLLSAGPLALIALGFTLALTGLISCVGALKEKRWMILVFFIVVLIIFILQISASVYLLLPDSVKEKSLSSYELKFIECLQTNKQDQVNVIDDAMNKLKCCGFKGYTDYTGLGNGLYPRQCCGKDSGQCDAHEAKKEKVRGCIFVLLEESIPVSGAVSFLMAIVEIFALFVSLKLLKN